ncbi:acyl carrier protein [Campylobacter sp. RM10532]|uniref:acyl carrier protein n=1 Tax=Campylobacter molothri TaxID=1032242 RepID=UPI001D736F1E|nr:acyl carrier protein [Campylobacter sp. RM10543]MBZ7933990.1 acyl carrier protein [Campylobacter sp. W0065]MBZ7945828.1 acyl carrier protein [Campylobacter sp. RM10532]MBZ7959080.1 acyl carrier protein [Campylobacter sp. RM12397]
MDKNEFLKAIAEILMTDVNNLQEETTLDSFSEFDSIGYLEITMLLEKELKIEINPSDIKSLKTIKDLLKLGKFA